MLKASLIVGFIVSLIYSMGMWYIYLAMIQHKVSYVIGP